MGTIKIRFKEEKGDQMFVKILTAMALDYRYSFFSKSIFSDSHNVNILNFLKYFCNIPVLNQSLGNALVKKIQRK